MRTLWEAGAWTPSLWCARGTFSTPTPAPHSGCSTLAALELQIVEATGSSAQARSVREQCTAAASGFRQSPSSAADGVQRLQDELPEDAWEQVRPVLLGLNGGDTALDEGLPAGLKLPNGLAAEVRHVGANAHATTSCRTRAPAWVSLHMRCLHLCAQERALASLAAVSGGGRGRRRTASPRPRSSCGSGAE